jgi:hypothetical protein
MLREEGHNLGPGEEIRILHPSMEGEELSVVLVKGWVLHVVEDDHIAKNLLNPFNGPSMQRKMLNANFDMKEPIWRMSVGI